MSTPNERDCEHGQLRRQCPLCELTAERDAAQADARELREKLGRVSSLVQCARNNLGRVPRAKDPLWMRECYANLDAALSASEPAERGRPVTPHRSGSGYPLPDPGENSAVSGLGAIMAATGKPGLQVAADHFANVGKMIPPAASGAGELPIMARATAQRVMYRDWKYPPNPLPEVDFGLLGVDGITYRIADTDEHGLPVAARTADMPKGAKYRFPRADGGWIYSDHAGGDGWQRIEDFTPAACTAPLPCDGGCVGEEV